MKPIASAVLTFVLVFVGLITIQMMTLTTDLAGKAAFKSGLTHIKVGDLQLDLTYSTPCQDNFFREVEGLDAQGKHVDVLVCLTPNFEIHVMQP